MANFLCEFYFETKNKKGIQNKVDDALNKKIYVMHIANISYYQIDWRQMTIDSLAKVEHYKQVIDKLKQENLKRKYGG